MKDVLQPDYDFSGAIEDLQLLFTLGNELAEVKNIRCGSRVVSFATEPAR